MLQMKLQWHAVANEVDAPLKTGEIISREDIKIAPTPIGNFWVGLTCIQNVHGSKLPLAYNLCWNSSIIGTAKTSDEAIKNVEKYYSKIAHDVHAQVQAQINAAEISAKSDKLKVPPEVVAVDDESIVELEEQPAATVDESN